MRLHPSTPETTTSTPARDFSGYTDCFYLGKRNTVGRMKYLDAIMAFNQMCSTHSVVSYFMVLSISPNFLWDGDLVQSAQPKTATYGPLLRKPKRLGGQLTIFILHPPKNIHMGTPKSPWFFKIHPRVYVAHRSRFHVVIFQGVNLLSISFWYSHRL